MEITSKTKLIQMMDAFVVGESRSRNFVSQMESEFAGSGLEADQRFCDLQHALAMFGVAASTEDERMLADECRYALQLLKHGNDT